MAQHEKLASSYFQSKTFMLTFTVTQYLCTKFDVFYMYYTFLYGLKLTIPKIIFVTNRRLLFFYGAVELTSTS